MTDIFFSIALRRGEGWIVGEKDLKTPSGSPLKGGELR
jgi:hypothetical protein